MNFVSVDGGATKTIAVCYDDSGNVLGVGVSGPSNFRNIGIENAGNNIKEAVNLSISRSNLKNNEINEFSYALAGVKDSKKSTEIIKSFITNINKNKNIYLYNDGEAGFNCRFPDEDGIVAAPGTGMIAYGKRDDKFERSSGWGWFLGDEGGAFYIGKRALQITTQFYDKRIIKDSILPESMLNFFKVNEPRELVNEVYTNPINIRKIASLSKLVSDMANKNDCLSISIIEEAARETARSIISIKKTLFGDINATFSGYGGVYRSGNLYWDKIIEEVSLVYPDIKYKKPLYGYHAVIGSIFITLKQHSLLNNFNLDKEIKDFNKNIGKLPEDEKERYLFM